MQPDPDRDTTDDTTGDTTGEYDLTVYYHPDDEALVRHTGKHGVLDGQTFEMVANRYIPPGKLIMCNNRRLRALLDTEPSLWWTRHG